ncbi:uncharacterized protein TORIP isoform X2 [Tribolium castaneum]|uniref:uncharacterized protein TORIP isoform X2 n=1 Tax=Tribolium castaneum TaxID=7070 RepID=UPI00046C12C0|nr:PREDICTED: uncharacterized protein LOC662064 isoform X2 [Tribolium castaneum]|eukprot:XP_976409.2 PREDICTED: uncharacterized protein LOC662064 isoform X2 [Tribolium castaneum]
MSQGLSSARQRPRARPSIHRSSSDMDVSTSPRNLRKRYNPESSASSAEFIGLETSWGSNKSSRPDSSLSKTFEDSYRRKQEESSESEDVSDSEDAREKSKDSLTYNKKRPELVKAKTTLKEANNYGLSRTYMALISVFLSLGVVLVWCGSVPELPATKMSIHLIQEKFPTQNDDIWLAFESGVNDVITRNRPSTFIFLYQEEAEGTLRKLLEQLSKYALCNIRDCSKKPIVLSDSELNSPQVVSDYGSLIEKYRDRLSENGVMIVKNLENVRGVSAQAFHTFCDEFTPLVEKSLFIFTMKVKELPRAGSMKFVDEYFRNKWTDIKIDTFNALITRITSMVVEVMP